MSAAQESADRARTKQAEQQQKKAHRLTERENKKLRDAGERAASTSQSRINQLERQAQQSLKARIKGPDAAKSIASILKMPGLRNARTFEGKGKTTARPAGRNGAVSFHFSVTSVSKGGSLADILKGRKSAFTAASTAVKHQDYIERDNAAEKQIEEQAAELAATAAKDLDVSIGRTPGPGAAAMQDYIDNPEKSENDDDAILGMTISSFGTIGDTPDERREFWKAVEDMEQNPSPPKVTLDPNARPDIWKRIRKRRDAGDPIPIPVEATLESGLPGTHKTDNDTGIAILRLFQECGLDDMSKDRGETPFPLRFKLGSVGRIQIRMVMELPHEMTPAQRLALAQDFCADFRRNNLPFWAVIHAPDSHNDHRNYHLHINLSERPAVKIPHPETGKPIWDFEYVEKFVTLKRQTRERRPKHQFKLAGMTKMTWIPAQRRRLSELANAHLERAGIEKRYDPRTYEEMGVEQEASERVPPTAFARERRGMITVKGVKEAQRQWKENGKLVVAIAKSDASHDAYRRAWLTSMIAPHANRQTPEALALKQRSWTILNLSDRKTAMVQERNAISHVAAQIASRATLVAASKRTAADKAALATAAEMRTQIEQIDLSIQRVIAKIKVTERNLVHDVQADRQAMNAENVAMLRGNASSLAASIIAQNERYNDEQAPVEQAKAKEAGLTPEEAAELNERTRAARLRKLLLERAKSNQEAAAAQQTATPARPITSWIEPRSADPENRPGSPVISNPTPPRPVTQPPPPFITRRKSVAEVYQDIKAAQAANQSKPTPDPAQSTDTSKPIEKTPDVKRRIAIAKSRGRDR